MQLNKRILLFLVLPIIAPLIYPPETLLGGVGLIAFAVAMFVGLGLLLFRGYSLALTMAIFLQGMNVIVRLMMLFPHAKSGGSFDVPYIILTLISIGLSMYLLLRLDRADVRVQMIRS